MGRKNLVMGLAMNYEWDKIHVFVLSLRASGFKGEVILFVSVNLDKQTEYFFKKWKIVYHKVDVNYLCSIELPKGGYLKRDVALTLPYSVSRILLYYEIVRSAGKGYESIMLCDIRDVVFQKDPFFEDALETICFFLEPQNVKIKNESWNALWVVSCFGVEIFNEICDNPVSCFGTILGPSNLIKTYLELMISHLLKVELLMLFGIEQAVHNFIIARKEMLKYKIFTHEEGPIATVSILQKLRQDDDGNCVDINGAIYIVVHQYDRIACLKEYYENKYTSVF